MKIIHASKAHCSKGGLATVFENGFVTILKGTWKIRVMHNVKEIPLTFEGKATHNVANCLPSCNGFLFV